MSDKYSPGHINNQGKQGTFLEGEESKSHTHSDGSRGTDVEAYRNTYRNNDVVHRERASDWGKEHRR
ncbi:MAG: hypothetical protein PHZ25_04210 [Candidatus Pacebacteria bacterium]|nr:hypothetical protein [Candidatus Paceibacterota bacterium]